MIKKSVGFARNLIKKHKEVIRGVRTLVEAEEVLLISRTNGVIDINGHTSSEAMTLYMLGTTLGVSFKQAKANNPELELDNYLSQPTTVAIRFLQSEGLIQ